MSFCTIYGNSASAGAGIAVLAGSVTMSNSIVVGNNLIAGKQPFHQNIAGELISKKFNLIQNMVNIAPQHTSAQDTSNIADLRFTPVDDITVSASELTKIFDPQGLQYFDSRGLQSNSGRTRTYKLLSVQGNPAVDAIPLADCHATFQEASGKIMIITTDQRGMPRPDDKEQFCDIGAYEFSG